MALRSFLSSFGATAASTFVGVYAVIIGATSVEMGWLQSSSNAITNGAQILWGKLSDSHGRKKIFLVAGSLILGFLWYLMPYSSNPVNLIIIYSLISLFGSLITVNWFSLIANLSDSSVRGKFLSFVNIMSSIGTLISLTIMVLVFGNNVDQDIEIPFFTAALTYIISSVFLLFLDEGKNTPVFRDSLLKTFKESLKNEAFSPYFKAMNVQGFFWSMAWPMFPITIVSIMNFSLTQVAILSLVSISVSILIQYLLGRMVDKTERPPLIVLNRIMLSLIPLFYGFFHSFLLFIIIEVYSGFLGALQNVVMNAYLLDIIPNRGRAKYISIINGFNGLAYLCGALTGGYMLSIFQSYFPLQTALEYSYIIVFSGRFISSLLFLKLKEPGEKKRKEVPIISLLYREKLPGNPSGGTIKMR
ncbi:MFS transporter [Caldiplasma sukawensis]